MSTGPYNTNTYNYLSLAIDSYKNITKEDENLNIFKCIKDLIKLRHDTLHLYVEGLLTDTIMDVRRSIKEYNLKQIFNLSPVLDELVNLVTSRGIVISDINKLKILTPDMILCRLKGSNGSWSKLRNIGLGTGNKQSLFKCIDVLREYDILIIDVTITSSINQRHNDKVEKYKCLKQFFNGIDVDCIIRPVATSVSMSTLYQDLEMLSFDSNFKFDAIEPYMAITSLIDSIENALNHIKQIANDHKAVEFFMMREYGDGTGLNFTEAMAARHDKNFEVINRMYNEHMSQTDDHMSMIDEMGKTMESCKTDEEIAFMLKQALENSRTDSLFEVKTSADLINEVLEETKIKIGNDVRPISKPSLHLFTPFTDKFITAETLKDYPRDDFSKLLREQKDILNILSVFQEMSFSDSMALKNISELSKSMIGPFVNNKNSAFNFRLFNNNEIINEEFDRECDKAYSEYKGESKRSKNSLLSKLEFLKSDNEDMYKSKLFKIDKDFKEKLPLDSEYRSFRQKMLKIDVQSTSPDVRGFLKLNHSGTKSLRNNKEYDNRSVGIEEADSIDSWLDNMSAKDYLPSNIKDNLHNIKSDEFIIKTLSSYSQTDNHVISQLKKESTEDIMSIMNELRQYPAYWFSLYNFLLYEQLCHFSQFTLPTNTFSIFNSGFKNICVLVQNSYHDSGKDVGKAFLVFGYTDKVEEINNIYGKIEIEHLNYKEDGYYFFATSWRRITTTKLTFMKDQFFSTLSTAITALLRCKTELSLNGIMRGVNYIVRHHYTLKVLVGFCSNQKTAEMLADMRYAIMSSFSEFSRIDKFIKDKFSPPFSTSFDMWVFRRLENVRDFVSNINLHRSNMKFKQPKFIGNRRSEDSIGGSVNVPSIWDNFMITDLQDILDDLFLYVHTAKEPSSIHHENIKSINTIIKYQDMYDRLTDSRKKGDVLGSTDDLIDFLTDTNIIGHSSDIVMRSSSDTLLGYNPDLIAELFVDVLNEPLSNITSTKAAIPEYKRTVEVTNLTKKKINIIRNEVKDYINDNSESEWKSINKKLERILMKKIDHRRKTSKRQSSQHNEMIDYDDSKETESILISEESKIFIRPLTKQVSMIPSETHLPGGIRAKVHDCLLDFLENNPDASTVLDLAEWNVCTNKSLVHADICIKAQYGAKREFYVINIGAKAQARLLEEFFHKICNLIPNEMISVPGDRKLLKMQDCINANIMKKKSTHSIYYTNGDCTKWSAAETMECFYSLIKGMEDKIPAEAFKLCKIAIRSWGMKKINIPVSVLTNTYKISEGVTDYLEKCTDAQLPSTQNFLQGMFNYMSSFKAVCCSNYTNKIWKLMYPESDLTMDHLEHSDDYVLLITVRSEEEMLKFRKFHRMMMKLHGFNDSEKKTNTQKFLMEFISLASMNGHMTYPQIKKTKEVGLNMGCTGFRDDIDTAISRVGEAIRIGTPGDASYAMQKIHLANVYRSYSLFQEQRNNIWKYENMMEFPVESFGMPDTFPIIATLSKGNFNNYRLYKFSTDIVKNMIKGLFSLEIINAELSSSLEDVDVGENIRLYHPTYVFNKDSKTIKKIRDRLNIDYDMVEEFWDNHKSYNFIKPICTNYLRQWMKSMYYRSNFTLAYSRTSRAQMTLRLSTYTSKKCMINYVDTSKHHKIECDDPKINGRVMIEPISIKDYILWLKTSNLKTSVEKAKSILSDTTSLDFNTMLLRTIMNCDSTIDAVYNMLSTTRLVENDHKPMPTVAMLTPNRLLWVTTNNSPTTLLQYIFNPDDLKEDMRSFKSHQSLEFDKEAITKYYKTQLSHRSPLSTVKTVFQDIIMSQQRKNLCMSYFNIGNSIDDFVKKHIEYGASTCRTFRMYTKGVTEAINPHTGVPYFKKNLDLTREEVRLMIDDMTLAYIFMKFSYNISDSIIHDTLTTVKFQDLPGNKLTTQMGYHDLMKFDIDMLRSVNCTNKEIQRFCYLKAVLEHDHSDMYKYLESSFSYTYDYIKLFPESKDGIRDQVFFKYLNGSYIAIKTVNNEVILLADSNNKVGILSAYVIGLKLFNRIKLSDLEHLIANPTYRNITMHGGLSEIKMPMEALQYHLGIQIQSSLFISKDKVEHVSVADIDYGMTKKEKGNPSIHFCNIPNTVNKGKTELVSKRAEIFVDRAEVKTGSSKVYSLPFLDCEQSNLTFFRTNIELNGSKINWWMNQSRIANFVKKGEVQCTVEELENIANTFKMSVPQMYKLRRDVIQKHIKKIPDMPKETIKASNTAMSVIDVINETTVPRDELNAIKSYPEGPCTSISEYIKSRAQSTSKNVIAKRLHEMDVVTFRQDNSKTGDDLMDFIVAEGVWLDIDYVGMDISNLNDNNTAVMLRDILGKDVITSQDVVGVLKGFMQNDPDVNKDTDDWIDVAESDGKSMFAELGGCETIVGTIMCKYERICAVMANIPKCESYEKQEVKCIKDSLIENKILNYNQSTEKREAKPCIGGCELLSFLKQNAIIADLLIYNAIEASKKYTNLRDGCLKLEKMSNFAKSVGVVIDVEEGLKSIKYDAECDICSMLNSITGKEEISVKDVEGCLIGFMENDEDVDKSDDSWLEQASRDSKELFNELKSSIKHPYTISYGSDVIRGSVILEDIVIQSVEMPMNVLSDEKIMHHIEEWSKEKNIKPQMHQTTVPITMSHEDSEPKGLATMTFDTLDFQLIPEEEVVKSDMKNTEFMESLDEHLKEKYGKYDIMDVTPLKDSELFKAFILVKERLKLFGVKFSDADDRFEVNCDIKPTWAEDEEHLDIITDLTNVVKDKASMKISYDLLEDIILENLIEREKEDLMDRSKAKHTIMNNKIEDLLSRGIILLHADTTIVRNATNLKIRGAGMINTILELDILNLSDELSKLAECVKSFNDSKLFFTNKMEADEFLQKHKMLDSSIDELMAMTKAEVESIVFKNVITATDFQLIPLDEEEDDPFNLEFDIKQNSANSNSSDSGEIIDNRQINYHELASMEPIMQKTVISYNVNLPHNIYVLKSRGDPTEFMIQTNYVTTYKYTKHNSEARLYQIQKLKFLLQNESRLSEKQNILCLNALERLNNSFCHKVTTKVNDDYVVVNRNSNLSLCFEINDMSDERLISQVLNDGAFTISFENRLPKPWQDQVLYLELDNEEMDEAFREMRYAKLENYMEREFFELNRVFEEIYNTGGSTINRLKKKYGLGYVSI